METQLELETEVLGDLAYQLAGRVERERLEAQKTEEKKELARREGQWQIVQEEAEAEAERVAAIVMWTPTPEAQIQADRYAVGLELLTADQGGSRRFLGWSGPAGFAWPSRLVWVEAGQLVREKRFNLRAAISLTVGGLVGLGASLFMLPILGVMSVSIGLLYGWALIITDLPNKSASEQVTDCAALTAGLSLSMVIGYVAAMLCPAVASHALRNWFLVEGGWITSGLVGWLSSLMIPRRYQPIEVAPGHVKMLAREIKDLGTKLGVDVSRLLGD